MYGRERSRVRKEELSKGVSEQALYLGAQRKNGLSRVISHSYYLP